MSRPFQVHLALEQGYPRHSLPYGSVELDKTQPQLPPVPLTTIELPPRLDYAFALEITGGDFVSMLRFDPNDVPRSPDLLLPQARISNRSTDSGLTSGELLP